MTRRASEPRIERFALCHIHVARISNDCDGLWSGLRKARGEAFQIIDELPSRGFIEMFPIGHVAPRQSQGDGPEQILITGGRATGGAAEFIDAQRQISGPWIKPLGIEPIPMAAWAMTTCALLHVGGLARLKIRRRLLGANQRCTRYPKG